MNKICTSIEQSQKFIELGISLDTADMYHAPDANIIVAEPYITKAENETLIPAYKGAIPAWSFSALLGLMPDKISINNESYYLFFTKKSVEFRGPITWDGQKAKSFEMDNILDAAFEMICWLIEQGFIKVNK